MRTKLIIFIFFAIIYTSFSQDVHWAKKIIDCSTSITTFIPGSPSQILGKFNVMPNFGKTNNAFTLQPGIRRNQYIVLEFDTLIYTNQIVICENYNPGSVSKITLTNYNGVQKVIYENINPQQINSEGRFWNIFEELNSFPLWQLRIDFNTANFNDITQIDAIGITHSKNKYEAKINFSVSNSFAVEPENLLTINSDYSELAPIISSDGNTLFFTREGNSENIGGKHLQDVWYALAPNGIDFSPPVNIGPPINNQFHNFAISVTPDNNTLMVGNVYNQDAYPTTGISISNFDGKNWSYPEKMSISGMESKSPTNSYSLGNDNKTLLLSIEKDDSYGEHDLYVSFLQKDGSWSFPMNLGPEINTSADEESPFLASDGKTLYFSGDGYPGYGRNDIFMTRRLDDTWQKWSNPINLGDKINTVYWDAYFSVAASGNFAYYVSSNQSPNSEDIYRIKLHEDVRPLSVVLIKGRVLDNKDKSPLKATIIYEDLGTGKEIGIAHSNQITGEYQITLPAGTNYGILAQTENYIALNENLNLTDNKEYKELSRDLFLIPIQKGAKIKLNNIFFDTGKYEILPESFPELNRIAELLSKNINIRIRLEGHTDNVGSPIDNLELSRNRARAILQYLSAKGISPNRLISKGYGEKKPVASNSTEEGRKLNRRVEFIILEK